MSTFEKPDVESRDVIKALIARMSPAQKAGQLFLLAYPGEDPEVIRPLIERYGLCGCYISQDNARTFAQARVVTGKLQAMSMLAQGLPLLLGVDQEGAWGVLVPQSHTGPGNLALGSVADPGLTRRMYAVFGSEMLSVGYNALLGPCADVNSNPDSPIIGTRAFGEEPAAVAKLVAAAVQGVREAGSVATLKHFPGHGATSGDTHREIPTVDASLAYLLANDLLPFRAGIDAGAAMVMTSHIRYPQIDPENPATLSHVILKEILRKILGFQGVVLSDSMNMGAIRRFYDPAESTLLALEAGVDVVMLSEEHYDHDDRKYLDKQLASLELVREAIESGRLDRTEVDAKLERILRLKLQFSSVPPDPSAFHGFTNREAEEVEAEAAWRAIRCVGDGIHRFPMDARRVVVVNATPRSSYWRIMNARGIGPNQVIPGFDALRNALEIPAEFLAHEDFRNGSLDRLDEASAVVVVVEDFPLPGEDFEKSSQKELAVRIALEFPHKCVLVALRSAYDRAGYPPAIPYVCAYSSRECSARAMARYLEKVVFA
jgi:beta-N-acetylhexosaminidase